MKLILLIYLTQYSQNIFHSLFTPSLWNLVCMLQLQHISIQTGLISNAQWPHMSPGCGIGQCTYGIFLSPQKTSIGQPWSRVYLLYMKGVRNIIPDVLDFHVPVVPEKLSVNRIFFVELIFFVEFCRIKWCWNKLRGLFKRKLKPLLKKINWKEFEI